MLIILVLSNEILFFFLINFLALKIPLTCASVITYSRTPLNTDTGHVSVSRVTNSHTSSTPLYGHWLTAQCLFSLLFVLVLDIAACSNNDRSLRVGMILFPKQ